MDEIVTIENFENTFEQFGMELKDRLMLKKLDLIHKELVEVNMNLKRIQGTTPSPS